MFQRKKGVNFSKKRKFMGNQHTPGGSKAKKVCFEQCSTPSPASVHNSASVSDDNLVTEIDSIFTGDTPTTSQKKLLIMYKVIEKAEGQNHPQAPETDHE
ncbi:hypothetical protein V1264_015293 [Littorina saxatilis]|uniref:Uncharacterized protein n=1 Tax=Littorina saxatilis TaxID=31220 RepID=A0AAN9BJD3_9CAEN